MDELVASAVAHWGPRFTDQRRHRRPTSSGSPPASSTGTTGAPHWVAAGAAHEAAGPRRARRGAHPLRRRAPRPGRGLPPLRQVRLRRGPRPDAGGPRPRGRLPRRRAAPPRPARPTHRDALRGQPPGRPSLRVPRGEGPHPVVVLVPGLDSTKEELRSTEADLPRPRARHRSPLDGPGQGEAEYDLPIRGDWAPVAEDVWDGHRRAARDRPLPARGLGRQPRRLLRAAGRRGARRPGQPPASRWPAPSTSASTGPGCRS